MVLLENMSSTKEQDNKIAIYARGNLNNFGSINAKKHKRLKKTLSELKEKITTAATNAADAEILLPSSDGYIAPEGNEKTYKLRQSEIRQHVDMNTEKNIMELHLTKFGPYRVNYSRNGRNMLFAGQKGHIATLDCMNMRVGMELQLEETVHDICYLQNETLFAAAQKKYTFIYDYKGVEIHCLKTLEQPYRLGFLPYHYLLTCVGHSGWIKWQDVSIGETVASYSSGHGPCHVLKHNPNNAIAHLGHSNGVVSLWSPAAGKALVSMFCHRSSITDIAIDREGRYMATAGHDSLMKIWDLRKYTCIHAYKTDHPVMSLDFSDKGLLAMGIGRTVQILKDPHIPPSVLIQNANEAKERGEGVVSSTYMRYEVLPPRFSGYASGGVSNSVRDLASSIHIKSVKFRPLEDVLCIGHTHGINTIVVPGAGEANFDSFEANPFSNPKQRREQEIQGLLHKLSHETIGLDSSFIGKVDKDPTTLRKEQLDVLSSANSTKEVKEKNKMRGRNKISAKLRRKQKNVIDSQSIKLKAALESQKVEREKKFQEGRGEVSEEKYDPLNRFAKKSK